MNPSCASPMVHISYWKFFQEYYAPLLKEADILLKTMDDSVPASEVARVLAMKTEMVEKIMAENNIESIDRNNFLHIMMLGDSSLCQLVQREFLCGSPEEYSPAKIAYIYGLQSQHVTSVCQKNGFTEIPARAVPALLDKIYVYII